MRNVDMNNTTRKSVLTLIRERRGAVAVMVALGVTMLAGFTGLALDVGSYYMLQLQLQNTADAAAMSAVTLVKATASAANNTEVRARAQLARGRPRRDDQL